LQTLLPQWVKDKWKEMGKMIRKVINANRKLSGFLRKLRLCKLDIYAEYKLNVHKRMHDNQIIVDIGGGKKSPIAEFKNEYNNLTLIAIDISDDELEANVGVDKKIVADVTQKIPLPDESIDMIISSSVLEHLKGQEEFVKNASKLLKSNGKSYFIHVFPSKFALFALLNQLLPTSFSKKLVTFISPGRKSSGVFPAYYEKCYYSSIKKLLIENGFKIEQIKCSYYQSEYFSSFFPVYVLSLLWDNLCYIFKLRNLCSYMCIIAKK
jgi:ubiquinone/menaquinone biosynthesis C-methylase UbiE